MSQQRNCCRVSSSDKNWWVDPFNPRPDAVARYSGCTLGKHRTWFLPDDRNTAFHVGVRATGKRILYESPCINITQQSCGRALVTDLVILNHGQVYKTTSELAQTSPDVHTTPTTIMDDCLT
ncbi:hypothetical protein TNCV_3432281 [Trichonephila clavipes]|nr:hypothetical protein TNCV_3432281 [Trichonephila clavipes]